jgi:hypothetical protein
MRRKRNNKKIYIFFSLSTSLSHYALLMKIPSIEIQGFKYGSRTPQKTHLGYLFDFR